ncbi:hypothetical protein TNCV_5021151 [Trichonephila clavipes]|nr:hypothetical protein TNCV_5021151 [Trichonephila clavipes]
MLLPISMFSSPSSSSRTVAWGKRNADYWPTCIEPSLMKPITYCLAGHPSSCCQEQLSLQLRTFSVLFRRAVNCIYRSSVDVVARGRHAPGRRLTFPVSWNPQPCNNTSVDSNNVRDTPLCLPGFQSAYNTPCHGFRC